MTAPAILRPGAPELFGLTRPVKLHDEQKTSGYKSSGAKPFEWLTEGDSEERNMKIGIFAMLSERTLDPVFCRPQMRGTLLRIDLGARTRPHPDPHQRAVSSP